MKNKKNLWIVAALISAVFVMFSCEPKKPQPVQSVNSVDTAMVAKRIAMVIPITVDAFIEIESGLKGVCPEPNYHVEVFSALGDPSRYHTMVEEALKTNPDYFVAIGSQIVTAALTEKNKEVMPPTIAGSISVPSAVPELVNIGINPPRNFPLNIVSQVPPISYGKVVDLLFEIKPSIKKIGILYNESEMNSNNMRIVLEKLVKDSGATPLLGNVTSFEDVSKITGKLLRMGAEAIIIPHDKYSTGKASAVAKLCNEKNVLTISLDDGIIKDGVMFAVSVPYVEVGNCIGRVIVEATENHVDLKEMPMIEIKESDLRVFVNAQVLKEKGITVSDEIVDLPIVNL